LIAMNDRPTPLELIRIANDTLASDVLPGAAPEQLYALRMIASALGIAARELAAQDADAAAEARGLDVLYKDTTGSDSLHLRNQQFAADIRRGVFETSAARESQLRQHLLATARAKLAAAHPRGLLDDNKNKN